jgi:hypothetical protein
VSACISAVQHVRPLRGGSQSQLLRASDGQYYVTKFQNNPQHVRVLANEMLATRLGQLLGLPVPRVTAIEVCGWLIAHKDDLRMDVAGLRTAFKAGLHLGSAYAADPIEGQLFDYLREGLLQQVTNIEDFARVPDSLNSPSLPAYSPALQSPVLRPLKWATDTTPCLVWVVVVSTLSPSWNVVSVRTVSAPQTIVSVLLLPSILKSVSLHLPLLARAFSISARITVGDPFDIAASCALRQALLVIVCPSAVVTVFSQFPARILSCACNAVAALSMRHITADTIVVLNRII